MRYFYDLPLAILCILLLLDIVLGEGISANFLWNLFKENKLLFSFVNFALLGALFASLHIGRTKRDFLSEKAENPVVFHSVTFGYALVIFVFCWFFILMHIP